MMACIQPGFIRFAFDRTAHRYQMYQSVIRLDLTFEVPED